jgi:thymidylate synthase ThyX
MDLATLKAIRMRANRIFKNVFMYSLNKDALKQIQADCKAILEHLKKEEGGID